MYLFIMCLSVLSFSSHSVHFQSPWLLSQLDLYNTPTGSLQRGKTPTNKCSGYDTKKSDGEFPVFLELWGMRSISSLSSLPGPLWPKVVASDRDLSMGQTELNCVLMLNWILRNGIVWYWKCILMLNWIIWNGTVFWHWNCVLMLNQINCV